MRAVLFGLLAAGAAVSGMVGVVVTMTWAFPLLAKWPAWVLGPSLLAIAALLATSASLLWRSHFHD